MNATMQRAFNGTNNLQGSEAVDAGKYGATSRVSNGGVQDGGQLAVT
jgi:hypothetical protein